MIATLIIPAYNEAERIQATLQAYVDYFGDHVHLHIVLNGCIDATEQLVATWADEVTNITYSVFDMSLGKGWAVRKGFALDWDTPFIGFVDADGATPPEETEKLIQALESKKYDGAIASRYAPGSCIIDHVSVFRRIAGKIFRLAVKSLVRLPYDDTQCGAKVFTKEVITTLLPEMTVDNMAFDIELLLLCQKYDFNILEIPTNWHEKKASTFITTKKKLLQTSFRMLVTTWQLRKRFIN